MESRATNASFKTYLIISIKITSTQHIPIHKEVIYAESIQLFSVTMRYYIFWTIEYNKVLLFH